MRCVKTAILAALLLRTEALPTQAEGNTTAAHDRLKERVRELYHKRTSEYGWYYRLVFAAAGRTIAANIARDCITQAKQQTSPFAQHNCSSDSAINQAIQQQVYHLGKHAATSATYGIVFAGIMLSAYGGAKFSHFLSKRNISESTKNFINVFVPIITGMGVFSIGAPLWDPAKSFIRRWAFANNQFASKPDSTKYPSRPELEQHWLEMQRYFSVNAQISRNTLSAFLLLISPSLQDARHAYDAGQREYAAAQLAKCLVQLRYIYSELKPNQPILVASVRSYFRHLVVSPQFAQSIVEIALTLDPLIPPDPEYYTRAVQVWFSSEH